MNLSGAIAGGLGGGLLGGLVWVGIGYATGYELGILAIGVGLACGIGVAMGTKGHAGVPGGIVAALCAIVAIVAARFVLVEISLDQWLAEAAAENGEDIPGPDDDEYWLTFIADREVQQRMDAGDDLNWDDTESDDEMVENDYPADVWASAQEQWSNLSMSQRDEFCTAARQMIITGDAEDMAEFRGVASIIGVLVSNFHPMALFIMAIAVCTAFKVARDSRPAAEAGLEEAFAAGPSPLEPTGLPNMPPPSQPVAPPSGAPRVGAAPQPPALGSSPAPTGLPGMPPPSQSGPRRFGPGLS